MQQQHPSCIASDRLSKAEIPNVAYHAWLGGGKLMFAKLLSVLSVHYLMKPDQHILLYDEEPNDALEWQCACRVARCERIELRSEIFGNALDRAVATNDRYASDRLGRCANAQLDLLRIDTLLEGAAGGGSASGSASGGGFFLDLDVYILKSLDPWRRQCASASAVFGRDFDGLLNPGVLLAPPSSAFLHSWRESFRSYRARAFDYGACNHTTDLAARLASSAQHHVHAAAELGPLPRYRTTAAYDAHITANPVAHLSAFRHPWRLHDIMNARHLERIWEIVARSVNESKRANPTERVNADPLIAKCLEQVAGACWARRGGKCGIYGA